MFSTTSCIADQFYNTEPNIRAFEPTIFSTLSPGTPIRFKYSGGSTPGRDRTVCFVSWFWDDKCQQGYLQAYDETYLFKTYHYSKMSMLKVSHSVPEQETEHKPESVTPNALSNWTSLIKQGDIIEFTYKNLKRNVTFVNFIDNNSSTKQKIMCSENGYTKTFFINKMTIHKIFPSTQDNSVEEYSPQVVQESKKDLLIKEMKAHIDSQNINIDAHKNLNKKYYNEVQQAYSIMDTHKMRYPSTWETDYVPRESWSKKY